MRSFSSHDYEAKQLRALKKQSKQLRNLRKGRDGIGLGKKESGNSKDRSEERQDYSEGWDGYFYA